MARFADTAARRNGYVCLYVCLCVCYVCRCMCLLRVLGVGAPRRAILVVTVNVVRKLSFHRRSCSSSGSSSIFHTLHFSLQAKQAKQAKQHPASSTQHPAPGQPKPTPSTQHPAPRRYQNRRQTTQNPAPSTPPLPKSAGRQFQTLNDTGEKPQSEVLTLLLECY